MPRKYTKKNKRGGDGETTTPPQSSSMFDSLTSMGSSLTSSVSGFGSSISSGFGSLIPSFGKKEETVNTSAYPTEGGRRRRKRRRMRGGSYSPNSSFYGADASPYSGPPTARAQAWVGGRKSRKKRKGSKCR